jgi:ribosomal protein S27AE
MIQKQLDWHMLPEGVQVYNTDAPEKTKWVTTANHQCNFCGHVEITVAPLNSFGCECTKCGYVDMLHKWTHEV